MSTNYGDIFWKGYDRGHAAVSDWDENKRKGLARKGMKELDSATTADPNAAQADAYARENAATAAQDNETFGTQAAPEDYQYGTPQLTEARGLGDAERYRRAETIYRDQGFDDKAEQYGERSRIATRQEKEDVRTARRDALSEKATGLQIRSAERGEKKEINLEAFDVDFATYQAEVADKKKPFNIGEMYAMAQKHGVPVDEVNKRALNQLGVDEKVATAKVQEKLRDLGEAAAKGMDAMLEMADPDPTDGLMPTIVTNSNGSSKVMYGGKDLYQLPPAAPGISQAGMLYQQMKGTVEGNPIAAGIQFLAIDKARMDLRKGDAQIGLIGAQTNAANANAAESRAGAGLKARTDPNRRGGAGGAAGAGTLPPFKSHSQAADKAGWLEQIQTQLGVDAPAAEALYRKVYKRAGDTNVDFGYVLDRFVDQASAPRPAPPDADEPPATGVLPRKAADKPRPTAPQLVMSEEEKRSLWADGATSRMLPNGLTRKPDDDKYRKVDPRGTRY